jgi:hypothetical protein
LDQSQALGGRCILQQARQQFVGVATILMDVDPGVTAAQPLDVQAQRWWSAGIGSGVKAKRMLASIPPAQPM